MDPCGGCLTEHLLFEILKILPIKSLVRFTSVSKPWSHLIKGPDFVTYHLQFNKSSSPSSSSVLGIGYGRQEEDKQQFEYFRIDHTKKTKPTLEHRKIPLLWPSISIRGHCNGLVLGFESQTLYVNQWSPKHSTPRETKSKRLYVERYIICNPVARRFLILPESTVEIPNLYSEVNLESYQVFKKSRAIGFGFIDDVVYKVVRVTYGVEDLEYNHMMSFRPYKPPWIEAYDSRSCYWRRVPMNSEFSYRHLHQGVYNSFDRCLYWFGRGYGNGERYSTLVSFHLVDETWHETLLPHESRYDELHEIYFFGEYGDCPVKILGESVVLFDGDLRYGMDVWKMNKEDDNKVSWTHIHRLNFGGSPLGFIGDGELLLKKKSKLVLRDSKKMNDACFGFAKLDFEVDNIVPNFVESLLLLDGESASFEDVSKDTYCFREELRMQDALEEEDLSSMFDDDL